MAAGFNDGADRTVTAWNDDWKGFFEDVCKRTGLDLGQAMLFHLLASSHQTAHATSFTADVASRIAATPRPDKEPWQ